MRLKVNVVLINIHYMYRTVSGMFKNSGVSNCIELISVTIAT